MISLFPIFGSQNVPVQLKAGLSFLLAILLFPLIPVQIDNSYTFTVLNFGFVVIKEIFVGLTIGFASSLLFVSVQFAGRLMDTEMGFAMVQLIDPFTDTEATVTGQFQILIFSVIFLLINGHYFMLMALKKSFDYIPLFSAHIHDGNTINLLVTMVGNIFVLAIRLAAPVFCVLLLTTVALGVIARTVPQINIFFVGLPLKIGLGIITLAIVLPALATLFRHMVDLLVRDLWKLLYLMS
jgi:flagellar biosynthetic protein FliR